MLKQIGQQWDNLAFGEDKRISDLIDQFCQAGQELGQELATYLQGQAMTDRTKIMQAFRKQQLDHLGNAVGGLLALQFNLATQLHQLQVNGESARRPVTANGASGGKVTPLRQD